MIYCVGIIGNGYWGSILLRNFLQHEKFEVKIVCDRNIKNRESAKNQSESYQVTDNALELMLDSSIEVVVIATQASSHFALCREVLLHGKHVFIEKPLALSYSETEELIRLSERTKKTIFIDHTWLHSSGYRKLREVLNSKILGKVLRINSRRCDFGGFQSDANVLWNLMYHDVYLLYDLLGEAPLKMYANGGIAVMPNMIDGACAIFNYPTGIIATVICDMYYPEKIREFIVQCERGILVWNEMRQDRLCVVNKYAEYDVLKGGVNYFGDGVTTSIPIEERETLAIVLDDFYKQLNNNSHGNSRIELEIIKTLELLDNLLIN